MSAKTITKLFTIPAIIRRLTPNAGDTDKESYSVVASINCHIQPTRPDVTIMLEGKLFRTFNAWTSETANVRQGDLLIPSGNVNYLGDYIVQGVETWSMGTNTHKKLLLQQTVGS